MKRFRPAGPDSPASPPRGPVVDVHQHLWGEELLDALRRRSHPPRIDGEGRLLLLGEPPSDVVTADHDLEARAELNCADGVDLALLSPSSPVGIESLPPEDAVPLLAAWHALADRLERDDVDGFALWAAPALVEPDLDALATTLAHPRVRGLQVPATAMADPAALETLAPVLAVAEGLDLPVLVHPGPAAAGAVDGRPAWWAALADYPAQQAAAWFAWHAVGRSLLPTLRIAFVALAGLAPLHHERLVQRGGSLGAIDPGVAYETSSYGAHAVDAMSRVVGVDPLVHGSDRPWARPTDPGLGGAFAQALFVTNPAHLLEGGAR